MSYIFSAMAKSQRVAFQHIYIEYLRRRDGVPNLETRSLPWRESRLRHLASNLTTQPVLGLDEHVFARNLVSKWPEPGLEPRMLWALSVAKVSRLEDYGVAYKLKTCGFATAVEDDPHLYIELEELYHSRIILLALRQVGLQATMLPPSRITQLALKLMMRLPQAISDIIVMAAEVAGVTVFRMLAEKARELFQQTPQVLCNILTLLSQLLIDEVGHVFYVRSCLDRPRLYLARLILPLVAKSLLDSMPEVWPLLGRDRLLKAILAADMSAAVAAFPDQPPPTPELASVPALLDRGFYQEENWGQDRVAATPARERSPPESVASGVAACSGPFAG